MRKMAENWVKCIKWMENEQKINDNSTKKCWKIEKDMENHENDSKYREMNK